MKRIIKSLGIIAAMSVIVVGATRAYFSDTETSKGNVLSAGTIDISVDGENPWTRTFTDELKDMKPSQVRYISFTVKNVNSNPVRIWKHLGSFVTNTGVLNEPECTAEDGQWSGTGCTGNTAVDSLDEVITYDMSACKVTTIGCKVDADGKPIGDDWVVIIDEADQIKLDDIESAWIDIAGFLADKALQKDEEIKVVQSYHIQAEAGNEYQGDTLTFNIDILAQQLNAPEVTSGTLLMENKNLQTWDYLRGDGIWGFLIFKASDPKFDYTFKGHGLNPNTEYSLIYYPEPQTTWPWPVTVIDMMTTDVNGNVTKLNNPDIGMDLDNAKLWLVVSSDIPANNFTTWPPTQNMLFEYNLIDYDDTNI